MRKVMRHNGFSRVTLVAMTFWFWTGSFNYAVDGRIIFCISNYVKEGSAGNI